MTVEVAREAEVYGWDWSATTHAGRDRVVNDLLDAVGTVVALPAGGLQGWTQSVEGYDGQGYKLATVYFGGRDDVHCVASSGAADAVRSEVTYDGEVKTSRVDTRVDSLVPFDDLRAVLIEAAGPRTKVVEMRSSVGGESTGRTVYLGSPTSAVRVRLYEKWLESPGQYEEGTSRVEVQLRPPSRAKVAVSKWSRAETFCASQLTRRLADALGSDLEVPASLQKSRGTPDLERTLAAMGEQYGKAYARWMRVSGGDVGVVLDHLSRTRENPALGAPGAR